MWTVCTIAATHDHEAQCTTTLRDFESQETDTRLHVVVSRQLEGKKREDACLLFISLILGYCIYSLFTSITPLLFSKERLIKSHYALRNT